MRNNNYVIVLATSQLTRGGITSVIKALRTTEFWKKNNCLWIETHIDKSIIQKLIFFLRGYFLFILYLTRSKLIHIHLSAPMSVLRKIPFILTAYLFRKPIIIHFHAYSSTATINSKFVKLYRNVFSYATSIIVLSESWKKNIHLQLNIDINKISVIHNPSITVDPRPIYQKENWILYAGTLNSRKGFLDLIQAFSLIIKKHPTWILVFAGNGAINEGYRVCSELNILESVKFLGWINGNEKDRVFKKASIFCLPSYAEGFPMSVLDAWSYSLPVVTTPVGGILDVALDSINIKLVNPGNIEMIKESLLLMIENNDYRNSIVLESNKLIQKEFSLVEICRRIQDIYDKSLVHP